MKSQTAKVSAMFHDGIRSVLNVMSTDRFEHIRCQIIPKTDEIGRNAGDFTQTRHDRLMVGKLVPYCSVDVVEIDGLDEWKEHRQDPHGSHKMKNNRNKKIRPTQCH